LITRSRSSMRASVAAAAAAKRRTSASASFSPRSITDVVAWLPVTSAAIASRRVSADRGSAAGRCAVAAHRNRSHVRSPSGGSFFARTVRASDSNPRADPISAAVSTSFNESGAGNPVNNTASVAWTCPAVSYGKRPSAAAISPHDSQVFRLASVAARASNSFCTSTTAAGVRAICASALAASARMPTPSVSAGAISSIISGRSSRPIARIAVRRPLPLSPSSKGARPASVVGRASSACSIRSCSDCADADVAIQNSAIGRN